MPWWPPTVGMFFLCRGQTHRVMCRRLVLENADTEITLQAPNSDLAHLGMLPSMPSTNQLSELAVASAIVAPAATISFPVLSLIGPANGFSSPETIFAFFSSKTLTAAGGISELSGAMTTSPSLMPQRVRRLPVQLPSSTFLVSAM